MSNFVWFLLKILSSILSTTVPKWAAYNSSNGSRSPTTFLVILPIFNGSSTEWNHLYAVMKEAEILRQCVFSRRKDDHIA